MYFILNVGFMDDAKKSAQRFIQNNFQDKGRQVNIDLFLGSVYSGEVFVYNPIFENLKQELSER